jgi:hypothetical protein
MNTNAMTHTDYIFTVTAEWMPLPFLLIVAAIAGIVLYRVLRKRNPN